MNARIPTRGCTPDAEGKLSAFLALARGYAAAAEEEMRALSALDPQVRRVRWDKGAARRWFGPYSEASRARVLRVLGESRRRLHDGFAAGGARRPMTIKCLSATGTRCERRRLLLANASQFGTIRVCPRLLDKPVEEGAMTLLHETLHHLLGTDDQRAPECSVGGDSRCYRDGARALVAAGKFQKALKNNDNYVSFARAMHDQRSAPGGAPEGNSMRSMPHSAHAAQAACSCGGSCPRCAGRSGCNRGGKCSRCATGSGCGSSGSRQAEALDAFGGDELEDLRDDLDDDDGTADMDDLDDMEDDLDDMEDDLDDTEGDLDDTEGDLDDTEGDLDDTDDDLDDTDDDLDDMDDMDEMDDDEDDPDEDDDLDAEWLDEFESDLDVDDLDVEDKVDASVPEGIKTIVKWIKLRAAGTKWDESKVCDGVLYAQHFVRKAKNMIDAIWDNNKTTKKKIDALAQVQPFVDYMGLGKLGKSEIKLVRKRIRRIWKRLSGGNLKIIIERVEEGGCGGVDTTGWMRPGYYTVHLCPHYFEVGFPSNRAKVIIHELGHAAGMYHQYGVSAVGDQEIKAKSMAIHHPKNARKNPSNYMYMMYELWDGSPPPGADKCVG